MLVTCGRVLWGRVCTRGIASVAATATAAAEAAAVSGGGARTGSLGRAPWAARVRGLSAGMQQAEETGGKVEATEEAGTDAEVKVKAELGPHYVDVHAHLIHSSFEGEEDAIARKAAAAGLEFVIVNGLDVRSNRLVLELCDRHENLLPALGIYPIEACTSLIDRSTWPHDFEPPEAFDVDAEIDFIDSMAAQGRIAAVGEIGLDRHWITEEPLLQEQERVLRRCIEVAQRHDLPVILHTRKREARTFEILQEMQVTRADFHCYGGKLKLAKRIAAAGYYFSIPAVVERSDSFRQLARILPADKILTETDCPFMGPDRGERNDPSTVPRGCAAIADARGVSAEEMQRQIRDNFRTLFRR